MWRSSADEDNATERSECGDRVGRRGSNRHPSRSRHAYFFGFGGASRGHRLVPTCDLVGSSRLCYHPLRSPPLREGFEFCTFALGQLAKLHKREQGRRYDVGQFGTLRNATVRTVKAEIAGSKPSGARVTPWGFSLVREPQTGLCQVRRHSPRSERGDLRRWSSSSVHH